MHPSFLFRRRTASLFVVLILIPRVAHGIDEIAVEESIADLLPPRVKIGDDEETAETRQWAILPQIGYAPDTGPLVGAKYTHRNFFNTGVTLDIDGTYALEMQQSLGFSIEQPSLLQGKLLLALRARYRTDPQRDFFGLGNNEVGPEPASTNSFQDINGYFTAGWRPFPSLMLTVGVGIRNVNIADGKQLSHCNGLAPCPFTPEVFPDLPGVQGGTVNPLAISMVWNDRDDFARPSHGWRAIVKIIHTNKALLSDFEFTRYIVDLGYVRSFDDAGNYVAGLRIDGEWVDGPSNGIPYWELAELGGDDTMRGFFPHRFVGTGRALVNLEFKGLIYEFDFFDIWHVKIDGVVFGDGGRVFISDEELQEEFKLNDQFFERIVNDFRYSYGGGLRFTLGQALVARVDVGFSDEETGLVYLAFGQTF